MEIGPQAGSCGKCESAFHINFTFYAPPKRMEMFWLNPLLYAVNIKEKSYPSIIPIECDAAARIQKSDERLDSCMFLAHFPMGTNI